MAARGFAPPAFVYTQAASEHRALSWRSKDGSPKALVREGVQRGRLVTVQRSSSIAQLLHSAWLLRNTTLFAEDDVRAVGCRTEKRLVCPTKKAKFFVVGPFCRPQSSNDSTSREETPDS